MKLDPLLLASPEQDDRPIYLPSGASFIFSMVRVAGWTGDCCVMQRASDNAQANIGFGPNNRVDEAAILQHQGVSTVSFRQPLDQSGNGVDITQATLDDQATYSASRKRHGLVGMNFIGAHSYTIPSGVSIDRQNCTIIMVHAPQHCGSSVATFQLGTGTSNRISPRPISAGAGGVGGAAVANGTSVARFNLSHPSQPCVEIITSSSTGQKMRINGRAGATLPAASSVTMTGGKWGNSDTASTDYYGNFYFFAVYPMVLSDDEILWAEHQLMKYCGAWTNPVAFINAEGDSIRAGQGGGGITSTELMENRFFNGQVEVRNTGISGLTLANMLSNLENNALSAYRPDIPLNIHLWRGGNNDMATGSDPTALYALLAAAQPRLKAIGYDFTAFEDSQDRSGDATFQSYRLTWNSLHDANTAGFDAVIKNSLVFTDRTNPTLYNADQIHFAPAGYQVHADMLWNEAVKAALAITPVAIPALTANPAAISNLNLFINTNNDAAANMVRDGQNRIITATDSSLNAFNATQATQTSRPGYYRKAINGRPAFRFSGSNTLLLPAGFLTAGGGANTLILIYQSENTGDATQYLLGGFTSSTTWRWGMALTSTGINFQNRTTSSAATTYSRAWDTSPHIAVMRRTGTTVELIHDGAQVASNTNAENTSISGGVMRLGGDSLGTGSRFTGYMAMPLHYSKYLSNAELNTLGGALATDYGLPWAGL